MADEVVLTDENIPPMQDELFRLYSQGFLTDITLSCEDGKNFEAHRVLLAARSQYFYAIVPKLKVEPVIFLKGVKGSHLEKVLKYIYSGSAIVSRSQLKYVLEVARSLQVKGLQDLAPTELSRGTNTSFQGHSSNYSGSKTSSPIPSKGRDDAYHGKLSPRDVALQQQQKLYDKISLSSKKSPLGKSNANPQFSPGKKSKQSPSSKESSKVIKDDDNGEEIFKFQYQYISDDSEDMDRDDSNDSDFEVADKKNSKDLQIDLNSKKKRGRPGKGLENVSTFKKRPGKDDSDMEFRSSRKSSKSSTDDDSENSSDLDQDSDSDSEADSDEASGSDEDEDNNRVPHQTKVEAQRSGKTKENYYEPGPTQPPTSASQSPRRGRGPSINGKQILAVQCKVSSQLTIKENQEFFMNLISGKTW